MIYFILSCFAMFFLGIIIKICDDLIDEMKKENLAKIFAICYGIVLGMMFANPYFAELCLATTLAQITAKKIDHHCHVLALSLAFLIFFSILFTTNINIQINVLTLFFLMLFALLDEQEWIAKKLNEARPFLPFSTLVLFLFGNPFPFIGILLFDVGYVIGGRIKYFNWIIKTS